MLYSIEEITFQSLDSSRSEFPGKYFREFARWVIIFWEIQKKLYAPYSRNLACILLIFCSYSARILLIFRCNLKCLRKYFPQMLPQGRETFERNICRISADGAMAGHYTFSGANLLNFKQFFYDFALPP